MDFRDTEQEAAFRAEVRAWLRETLTDAWFDMSDPGPRDPDRDEELRRWWQRTLHDSGWAGLTWPVEYGGRGGTLVQQVIFNEEAARARAPEPINIIGMYMAGPTILAWGTEEHKRRYLPPLLSGEEIWCQGFSEPDAGSDLNVRMRAVRDGDDYVVTGQKVWTSYGHLADYCILVTRSDPDAPKYTGFTYLLADMAAEGVSVRPLVQITGQAEFNEIFFDDVRIPVANRLGDEGQGWQVAMTTLLHERGTLGASLQVGSRITLDRLVDLIGKLGVADDPAVRERIAGFQLDVEALRLTNLRAITKMERGLPGPEGSMSKLLWERVQQAMGEYAMELLGTAGQVLEGESGVDEGRWAQTYLRGRGHSIEAGTTEILKNIIAERVLGLPRSR
ncbi:MAG: acyl-CoA dehydrogenase family protein [Actinobacteria bacterium]|nr:acyl-CoA dehydrogenase family protein [Actinomycetota bacterium]